MGAMCSGFTGFALPTAHYRTMDKRLAKLLRTLAGGDELGKTKADGTTVARCNTTAQVFQYRRLERSGTALRLRRLKLDQQWARYPKQQRGGGSRRRCSVRRNGSIAGVTTRLRRREIFIEHMPRRGPCSIWMIWRLLVLQAKKSENCTGHAII